VARSGRPLQVLGAGSNVVAGDEGFDGVVLKLGTGFESSHVEGERITVGGAFFLPKLTHFALENRLGNLEWACGVPGSAGGSIWGNAGARGFNGREWESRDASSDLESLVAYDRQGRRHHLQRSDIEFSYRRSSLGDLIVAAATFSLKPLTEAETQTHRDAVKQLLKKRRETQPVNAACAGCIWKNPQMADCRGAGELIERLGLKGHRIGGAAISEVHANFIVNIDRATGADVRALMRDVEQKVLEASGVQLEREVRLLGGQ
jgi:UDP-N-acetylmuramate dehydrogenase